MIKVRRYLCLVCSAVVTVVPREVLHRRQYPATVIALALALYGVAGRSARAVRRMLCPWRLVGGSATGWATLRRWITCACAGRLWSCLRSPPPGWSTRRRVAQLARRLGAYGQPGEEILAAVWSGAVQAR